MLEEFWSLSEEFSMFEELELLEESFKELSVCEEKWGEEEACPPLQETDAQVTISKDKRKIQNFFISRTPFVFVFHYYNTARGICQRIMLLRKKKEPYPEGYGSIF